jgi:hypothetical protein
MPDPIPFTGSAIANITLADGSTGDIACEVSGSITMTAPAPEPGPEPEPEANMGDRQPSIRRVFPAAMFYRNGGRIIDVTEDITALPGGDAVGNAYADDSHPDQTTAAIKHAINYFRDVINDTGHNSKQRNFPIYFPIGTYAVNDSLLWDGQINDEGSESQNWRFIGERRKDTIIRLVDDAPGFGAGSLKPLLACIKSSKSSSGDLLFNNIETKSCFEGLTLDLGSGNLGAVGLRVTAANANVIEDITIRGEGARGLFFAGCSQFIGSDITIEGCDDGIFAEHPHVTHSSLEYVTLRNQFEHGLRAVDSTFGLRRVLSDQTETGVPALAVTGPYGMIAAVDCDLRGGHQDEAAVSLHGNAHAFLRDIATEGYGTRVWHGGNVLTGGGKIDEYATAKFTAHGSETCKSIPLPAEDVPAVAWPAVGDWAIVDGGDEMQAALNSGKPGVMICMGQNSNSLSFGEVTVPASVRFIHCMWADCAGTLKIGADSDKPLLICAGWDGPDVQQGGKRRTVILKHLGGAAYKTSAPSTDDVVHLIAMSSMGNDGGMFRLKKAKVFARMINHEPKAEGPGDTRSVFNWEAGCRAWVFGFKSETNLTSHRVLDAELEIIGGMFNQTAFASHFQNDAAEMVHVVDGKASVSGVSNGHNSPNGYRRCADATKGDACEKIPFDDLPPRLYHGSSDDNQAFLPLYVDDCG